MNNAPQVSVLVFTIGSLQGRHLLLYLQLLDVCFVCYKIERWHTSIMPLHEHCVVLNSAALPLLQ